MSVQKPTSCTRWTLTHWRLKRYHECNDIRAAEVLVAHVSNGKSRYRSNKNCKPFVPLHLFLLGGLEQIHCCEWSHSTPSYWAWWYDIQHGKFLHLERYLRNIRSISTLQVTDQRSNSIWHDRIILQHYPSATNQENRRWNPGGSHSAVLDSFSGQDQTFILSQLWWAKSLMQWSMHILNLGIKKHRYHNGVVLWVDAWNENDLNHWFSYSPIVLLELSPAAKNHK